MDNITQIKCFLIITSNSTTNCKEVFTFKFFDSGCHSQSSNIRLVKTSLSELILNWKLIYDNL